jgi:hypothetical protein
MSEHRQMLVTCVHVMDGAEPKIDEGDDEMMVCVNCFAVVQSVTNSDGSLKKGVSARQKDAVLAPLKLVCKPCFLKAVGQRK